MFSLLILYILLCLVGKFKFVSLEFPVFHLNFSSVSLELQKVYSSHLLLQVLGKSILKKISGGGTTEKGLINFFKIADYAEQGI